MRKKLFFKFFIFAVLATFVTFTSCKDYDDDIKGLETALASLKTTVDNMKQKIESGSTITSVETTSNGVIIKLSDGNSYTLTNGAAGQNGSVVTIGGNGNWFIDGTDTGKASKGADGTIGVDGTPGVDGIYYTPGEDGFWHKVDGETVTVTTDGWLVEGTITAKYEDGYVILYNVEGAEGPISIGLVGLNNLVLIPDHVSEDGNSVLNFATLITTDESKILQTTARYQVSPTNASEKLIDKDNLYFKTNNPEVLTRAADLCPKAEFISLENGILTVAASIDADALEALEEDGEKIMQLMLVVPSTSGAEVVSDFIKVVSVDVVEVVPVLSITPETLEMISNNGEDITFTIDTNGDDWELSTLPDWLTEKEKTVTSLILSVSPNLDEERTTSLTFNLVDYPAVIKVVEVTQAAFVPPVLEVPASETGLSIALEGGNVKIDIESNFDWIYTIENGDWLTEVSKTDTELELTASANDGAQRMATVTITSESTPVLTKKVIVTQLSAEPAEPVVIFKEDFEWLDPWAKERDAGRAVETDDHNAYSPQIVTPKIDEVSALDALLSKGYEFLRVTPTSTEADECIYLQENYLKFGKTGFQAGIILPKLEENAPSDVTPVISFDWCPQRQGSGTFDPVNLIVIIENGGQEVIFEVPEAGFEKGQSLKWIAAEVKIGGVELTKDTKITIRPSNWQLPTANRYYLDNIEIRLDPLSVGGSGDAPSLPPVIW